MAINFPDNPNVNDVHTESSLGKSWRWDGTSWLIYSSSTTGIGYSDLSVSTEAAQGGGSLTYNNANGQFTFKPAAGSGGGATNFTGLGDTPSSLTAGKWLKVNTGGTALEWTDAPTGNDTNDYLNTASLSGTTLTLTRTGTQSLSNVTVDLSSLNSVPTTITVANESTETVCYPLFTTTATGNLEPKTVTSFKLNSSSGQLEAGSFKKTGGSAAEFLKADGSTDSTTYLSSAPSYALNDLSDVDATTGAANGKILKYNGASWEVADDLTGGGSGSPEIVWTLTASGTSDYVFSGDGFPNATADPDITLIRGQTYKFTNNTGGHPFRIQTDPAQAGGGTQYNSGVTNNDASGASNQTLIFVVPMNAPSTLYYQCTAHPAMTGTINILDSSISTSLGGLTDVDTTGAANGKILKYNGTSWEIADDLTGGGGSANFTGLSDTPTSLTAGKWLKVNAGATALEWTDAPSGDTTYDLSAIADSGNAKVRLTGSDSTDDDVTFTAGGGISYAVTGNTVQISSSNSLGALTDTNISGSPTDNYVLTYDLASSTWEPQPVPGGSQNLFSTFAVAGQSNVVADTTTDTLTFSAGSNMTITTDANNDVITFASAGAGSLNIKYLQDTGPANNNYISYFTGVLGSYANYQFDTNYPTGFQSQSWNNWGGWINPWNAGGQQGDGLLFFTLSDNSETTWDLKLHSTSPNTSLTSGQQCRCWTSTDGENWVYQGTNNTISTTTTISITTAYLIVTDLGMGSGNEVYLEVGSSSIGGTSYLTKTGLSVNKLANSGTGNLTYNNAGVLTYTPPALTDNNDYVTNLSLSGTTLTAEFGNTSLNQTIDLASINTDTNTQLSSEDVQDIVGAMFTGNTETNITATYEDSDGTIDLVAAGGGGTNTTYDLAASADSGNAKITLSGSDSTDDDVTFTAGGGISYAVTGNTVQISSANSLGGLTDTNITGSPTDNYVLTYDLASSTWEPQPVPSGSTPTLNAVLGAGNTSTLAATVGNLTCSNLTVNGTTTTVNSNTVNIGDNILVLNSDETGTPSQNGGVEIERGTSTNVSLRWNETTDKWQYTNDGTNFSDIGSSTTDTNTTYDLEALISPGIKLAGSDSTNDSVFFDSGNGMSISRTNATDIEFSVNMIDEDDMASNSDTRPPTQQSVKAYVDANSGGTDTNDYVNTAGISGSVITLGRTGSLSDLTVDISGATGDVVPVGTIVMYNGDTAPTGWMLCDGVERTVNNSPYTPPDLRDKFIVGAGSSYTRGDAAGSADAVVVSHSHGSGNTGNQSANHSHDSGNYSGNSSTHNGHTHGSGNFSGNASTHNGHTHGSGNFSGNASTHNGHTHDKGNYYTSNQSANHYHTIGSNKPDGSPGTWNVSTTDGAHQHGIQTASWDNQSDYTGPYIQGGSNAGNVNTRSGQGNHSHTINLTGVTTGGVDQNHYHNIYGGTSGSDGNHSHNVNFSGNTGSDGSHSHTINHSGNSGNQSANHTHSVNINSEGVSGTGKNLPPYYAITFIIKTA